MERIEDLLEGPMARYNFGRCGRWLPALPLPMFGLRVLLRDAWLVLTGRATAVQWPHQRG